MEILESKETSETHTRTSKKSYGQVLKSSALIGASSMLDIGFRVIRTKVIALILGPSGIGLLGLYTCISELVRSVAGMGINSSGVRQIAEAVGSQDKQRIARTIITLRRVALCSGVAGGLLLVAFSSLAARLSFGDEARTASVALLALAVVFGEISAAQAALVQGMRRIADLAKINVLGAFYGTITSIPIIYFLGEKGLVPSLVCVAFMTILTSWWYARKVKIEKVKLSWRDIATESSGLLRLGFVFMAGGLMTMAAAYLVRIFIVRRMGVDEAGYFQAAWALGGIYAGFIVSSMGADFYPRLTAVASNNDECNRLVNEQTEVGLLLGGPGVICTLIFSPLVIQLFYSSKFGPAIEILRWICLGMLLRIGSWPMGFILLAKGVGKVYFWCELATNVGFVGLISAGVVLFKLPGSGIGFFAVYVAYSIGIYLIVRRMSGFRWSEANRRWATIFLPLIALLFVGEYFLPRYLELLLGVVALLFASLHSARTICTLVAMERFPKIVQKILRLTRVAPIAPPSVP